MLSNLVVGEISDDETKIYITLMTDVSLSFNTGKMCMEIIRYIYRNIKKSFSFFNINY